MEGIFIINQKMERSRRFCFTLNNYSEEEVVAVKEWECSYLIFGKEVSASGTPHLQGYVSFANAKTLTALKRLSDRAHWEISRGTPKQASEYCEKDADVFEKGTRPLSQAEKGDKEKERWSNAYQCVAEGRLDDLDAEIKCRHLKSIEYAIQRTAVSKRKLETLEELEHEWYVGPPGTGKSRKAREENPGAYIKDPTLNWWDGYMNEEVVIIDDFDKFQVKQGGDMKRWLDRYPFQAPIKGGYSLIRPKKIIVTSNYRPEEIWDDRVTVEAIQRRVTVVRFPGTPFQGISARGPGSGASRQGVANPTDPPLGSAYSGNPTDPPTPLRVQGRVSAGSLFTAEEMDSQLDINIGL